MIREGYLARNGTQDIDLFFLVSRINFRETNHTLRLNVQDTILFQRSEAILKVFVSDARRRIVQIEREKDKMMLTDLQNFFKARADFEVRANRADELAMGIMPGIPGGGRGAKTQMLGPLIVMAYRNFKSRCKLFDHVRRKGAAIGE